MAIQTYQKYIDNNFITVCVQFKLARKHRTWCLVNYLLSPISSLGYQGRHKKNTAAFL